MRKTGAKTRVGQQPQQRHNIGNHQRNAGARQRFTVPPEYRLPEEQRNLGEESAASEARARNVGSHCRRPLHKKATTAGTPGSKPSQKAS